MRYCLLLRNSLHYRRQAFESGLRAIGGVETTADKCDLLIIWNRYGVGATLADKVEARGGLVLVAENAAWGNEFADDRWYSIARHVHNTAGMFPVGESDRWDSLGVELAPWRPEGGEVVGLPQRGIGPRGTAMPAGWKPPGCDRIRAHPGTGTCVPLERDLVRASKVVTWGSGAAIKALMLGIRVESHMPKWIGTQDNTDAGRLAMFRRLAWAQWRVSEITNGDCFRWMMS